MRLGTKRTALKNYIHNNFLGILVLLKSILKGLGHQGGCSFGTSGEGRDPYLLTYIGVFNLVKREQLAHTALPTFASLCPLITTTKGEGFYVELFLTFAFPLERESKM